MCGIVGIAGAIHTRENTLFKTLLILDQLRGPHSTGVAAVATVKKKTNPAVITVCKGLGTPHQELFEKEAFKDLIKADNRILIGHNRFATTGSPDSIDCAHPFAYYNKQTRNEYCGVHNGTLYSQAGLKDHTKFEVDSENIYYDMAARDNSLETLEELDGAYALVWYETATGLLHMARNSQRPLYWQLSSSGLTLHWASEPWMIKAAADRCKSVYNLDAKVHMVPTGVRLSFKVPLHALARRIEDPKEDQFTPKSYWGGGYYGASSYGYVGTGYTPPRNRSNVTPLIPYARKEPGYDTAGKRLDTRWENWGRGLASCEEWSEVSKAYVQKVGVTGAPVKRTLYIDASSGTTLKYGEVKEALAKGCAWCSETLDYGDNALITDVAGGSSESFALCEGCYSDGDIQYGLGLEPQPIYGNYNRR